MAKKLLLVNPRGYDLSNFNGARWGMLPVTLPTVTALTPPDFDVRVWDEYSDDKVDFDMKVDLVGITVLSPQYNRARVVAQEFRRRGVPVVIGGPFPSLSPDRCRDFADVLFIGRSERTWPKFCADFLAGRYEKEYVDNDPVDFSRVPLADYRGFDQATLRNYISGIVHMESGCPHTCDFCDTIIYAGREVRSRPAADAVKEIDLLYRNGARMVFLASDNLLVKRAEMKDTLRQIAEWQKGKTPAMAFMTNIDVSVAGDEEFMELSAKAGLITYLIGFETPNKNVFGANSKGVNLKHEPKAAVKRIFEHGIQAYGYLMVGFDEDDLSIFQQQYEFQHDIGVVWANLNVVDAKDRTPLQARIIKEGRYIDFAVGGYGRPWTETKPNNVNISSIIPKNMTVQQLQQGAYWTMSQMVDWNNYKRRVKVFFETYEASPKKAALTIPAQPPPPQMPEPLRLALSNATPADKDAFEYTVGLAKASSHPQAFGIAMRAFMPVLGLRRHLAQQIPNIDEITYPA